MKSNSPLFAVDDVNSIRGTLAGMLASAKDHPRHTKAAVIKVLRSEIKALLAAGFSFDEIAAGLRNQIDFQIAVPTLKRYYYQTNTPIPKGSVQRRAKLTRPIYDDKTRRGLPAKSIESGDRAASKFVNMPDPETL